MRWIFLCDEALFIAIDFIDLVFFPSIYCDVFIFLQLLFWQIYRKGGNAAIPYYKLIIDPTNMMHTFDNSFQISFLFRDGLISFEKDDEDMPCIRPLFTQNKPPKPAENKSFVSRLDVDIIQVSHLFNQIFIFGRK